MDTLENNRPIIRVIAGTFEEYGTWKSRQKLNRGHFEYINSHRNLQDVSSGSQIILIGTYRERDDWFIMEEILRSRIFNLKQEEI